MVDALTSFANDGLTFDVVDAGPRDGMTVIALHGFPQTATSWSKVTPLLTDAGFRVLAPNQRGYSPQARPAGVAAYRLERLAADVLALADAAAAETFHLLGHDWGGGVAWYLAAQRPDRVRSLSVASTPHPRAMLAAMRGRQALRSWYVAFLQIPGLPERVLRARDGQRLRRLLERSGAPDPEPSVELFADPAAATATINWYRAMRRPGVDAPGRVSLPSLYVWSDHDQALGRRAALETANWVTGPYRFEIMSGVSHWIPEERPAELAELVIDHIVDAETRRLAG